MRFQFAAVLLAVLATASGIYAATDYCTVCPDHTMCKYTATNPKCQPRLSGGVATPEEQAIILDVHNAERSLVAMGLETRGAPGPQPGAANMAKLTWNNELATIAQRWADQCTRGHDTCRSLTNSSAGQNIYTVLSPFPNPIIKWANAVNAWINEVSVFSNADVAPYKFAMTTGHYTQAVWATTTSVGCGRTLYKDSVTTNTTTMVYVCNYAPAGNFITGKPVAPGIIYAAGPACSQCPAGYKTCSTTSATNKGLCSM